MKRIIVTAIAIFTTAVVSSSSTKQVTEKNSTSHPLMVNRPDFRNDIGSAD
ncbi:MAG: hypothetical protein ACHQF4_08510 [Sphingobacteriales bacterium]